MNADQRVAYPRVIPRDLFNEANLLKCLGQLWLLTEPIRSVEVKHDGESFIVAQDDNDGSLTVLNVVLRVHGEVVEYRRPLNSRQPWPLVAVLPPRDELLPIFTDSGQLSAEMLRFIHGDHHA